MPVISSDTRLCFYRKRSANRWSNWCWKDKRHKTVKIIDVGRFDFPFKILPVKVTWATFFFGMQRFSKECCSNFCRESISPVFCWCAKPREATSESTYKSGKIVFAKALCVGYQTERFFLICFIWWYTDMYVTHWKDHCPRTYHLCKWEYGSIFIEDLYLVIWCMWCNWSLQSQFKTFFQQYAWGGVTATSNIYSIGSD